MAGTGWGSALTLATVVALVAASIRLRDMVLLVISAGAALLIVPTVVGLWFPGVLSAALALLLAGLVLGGEQRRRWVSACPPRPDFRAWAAGTNLLCVQAVVGFGISAVGSLPRSGCR